MIALDERFLITIILLLFNGLCSNADNRLPDRLKKCADTNKNCTSWAFQGECYKNRGYMFIYCPESCDQCSIKDPKCIDLDIHCAAWSDLGECKTNHIFMKKACRRACSFCLPSTDKSLPYIRTNVVDDFWTFNTLKQNQKKRPRNRNLLPRRGRLENNLI